MRKMTYVVIGGGYAGIHTVKAIQKKVQKKNQSHRVILIDPNPDHIKKVLLFKPAAKKTNIKIPFKRIFPNGVEIIQGFVTAINHFDKSISVRRSSEEEILINYDAVIITVGSTFQSMDRGGIELSSLNNAERIHQRWKENIQLAKHTDDKEERKRLLTVTVVGAGISGIETSALLAEQIRLAAQSNGLSQEVRVLLINSKERLFMDGPEKLSRKLESRLKELGVEVLHNERATYEANGKLELESSKSIPTGLCVWTTGLVPNPILSKWELPLTENGRLKVDSSYRVIGRDGMYSIGDCARIIDPKNKMEDKANCKEATIQGKRLGKIIQADLNKQKVPVHKKPMTTYCIGLGEKQGLVWVALPTLNLFLSGKLGYWIRKMTWDMASLVK